MQKQYGLNVAFQTNGIETKFDSKLSELLFQTARELLFNVVKHAETLDVSLTLESVNDRILITVADKGQGFDTTVIRNEPGIAHGLLNIRQRLELMGCQMEIISRPGAGTRMIITCPGSS